MICPAASVSSRNPRSREEGSKPPEPPGAGRRAFRCRACPAPSCLRRLSPVSAPPFHLKKVESVTVHVIRRPRSITNITASPASRRPSSCRVAKHSSFFTYCAAAAARSSMACPNTAWSEVFPTSYATRPSAPGYPDAFCTGRKVQGRSSRRLASNSSVMVRLVSTPC